MEKVKEEQVKDEEMVDNESLSSFKVARSDTSILGSFLGGTSVGTTAMEELLASSEAPSVFSQPDKTLAKEPGDEALVREEVLAVGPAIEYAVDTATERTIDLGLPISDSEVQSSLIEQ